MSKHIKYLITTILLVFSISLHSASFANGDDDDVIDVKNNVHKSLISKVIISGYFNLSIFFLVYAPIHYLYLVYILI